jgi:hypothetical protein
MRDAEVLDRALAGEQPPSRRVAELVELARGLEAAWAVAPSSAASDRGLARALDAFQGDGQVVSLAPRVSRARRIVAGTAVAVAALVALPGLARAGSEDTLPGDLLYPVKLGFENLRLALADDPVEEASVQLSLAENRLEEAMLAEVLRRPDAEWEAVRRYRASILEFDANLGRARALGLDVAILVSQADVLLEQQNEVLAALIARPPDPAVPGIRRAIEVIQRVTDEDGERRGRPAKAGKGAKEKKPHGKAEKNPSAGRSTGQDRGRGGPEDPGRAGKSPRPRPTADVRNREPAGKSAERGGVNPARSGRTASAWEDVVSDLVRGRTPLRVGSLPRIER